MERESEIATVDGKAAEARQLIRSVLGEAAAPCVTCSFQLEDVALVHMLVGQRPDIPVLFLETGYHFPETYAYRDEMARRLGLNLINLSAALSVREQESQFGILYQTAPDRCCGMRKVEPLFSGLAGFDTWFTGLRREQSPTRANLQPLGEFSLPGGKTLRKISPLALWSTQDVWHYASHHDLPALPLYHQGYTSIGCRPCTAPPPDPENPRSGRWGGHKLECGIHVQPE
jgi:phosphoadenosine phosphosulfate reductase